MVPSEIGEKESRWEWDDCSDTDNLGWTSEIPMIFLTRVAMSWTLRVVRLSLDGDPEFLFSCCENSFIRSILHSPNQTIPL